MALTRDQTTGLLTSSTLLSTAVTYGYSGYGELSSIQAQFSGSTLFSENMSRDALGRISSKTEIVQGISTTYTYSYDLSGRLISVLKNGQAFATYQYDADGNRTAALVRGKALNGAYDAQDRLVSYGANAYTYKGNGDLASKANSQSGNTQLYSFDLFGLLSSVQLSLTTRVDYLNDGEHHRVSRQPAGQSASQLIYSERARIIGVSDTSGTVSHFVYATQNYSPDYIGKSGHDYLLIKDHLGSIRLVVDASSGTVVQALDYSEFGEVLSDSNPGFQPFGFAGGLYDPDTKLVRFGLRDYDPESGRWTSKDPTGFAGGDANLYVYAKNDPINFVDPTGTVIVAIGIDIPPTVADSPRYRQLDNSNQVITILPGAVVGEKGLTTYDPADGSTFIQINMDNIYSEFDLETTLLHELNHADLHNNETLDNALLPDVLAKRDANVCQ